MGVGSTGVAALRAGRRFIGVDADKNYYRAATDRLAKEVEAPAQLLIAPKRRREAAPPDAVLPEQRSLAFREAA